jgi:hypothetical protein
VLDLRELLQRIATQYSRELDMQSEAQLLLRTSSKEVLAPVIPAGYAVKGSGGQSTPAFVPRDCISMEVGRRVGRLADGHHRKPGQLVGWTVRLRRQVV